MTDSCPPVAIDSQGKPMKLHWVFTYCAEADAAAVRECCYEFMTRPNRKYTGTADQLLDLSLRPVGSTEGPTMYGCIRQCWCDELKEQRDLISNNCGHVPSFALMEADLQTALTALGMEVVV
jgi:hypothetical protein